MRFISTKKARLTAAYPFNISRNRTGIPAFLPNTRNVLVAPALPLPYSRISIPFNSLPANMLKGKSLLNRPTKEALC